MGLVSALRPALPVGRSPGDTRSGSRSDAALAGAGDREAAAAVIPVQPAAGVRPVPRAAATAIPDPTGVGPGQVTCGAVDGLVAGFWQRSAYEVAGFVWRAGVPQVLPQSSRPNAINDSGVVVGDIVSHYTRQAFRWAHGSHQPLGYLGGTDELGGRWSQAVGVNVRGRIVGTTSVAGGDRHAYLWADNTMTDLGTLGGSSSEGVAVNDQEQVCGNSVTATGQSHAFLWSRGRITDVGTLGGSWSRAAGLNARGQVAGTSEIAGGQSRAFLWERGAMRDLGVLSGDQQSEAVGINDNGEILVRSIGTQINAFVWSRGRRTPITGFGLRVDPGGISARGYVCGTALNVAGNDHAIRWYRGTTTDLGTLGGDYSFAAAITGAQTVVGSSAVAGAFVPQAVLWTL
ncbi:HAF repeat-containing protein [Frankia sp. AiPs1]|uniref:HAF repeat-containing protein n=1 Tax=Frankia sp. AiPs1 TaxID=573493 RepID=UPI002044A284|nr:HAF repeat-containing protein [Frankia sp. AiPs1]MCM3922936.1 HAF repeat-containing protein [Frankia sp. AiPs1]